MPSREDTEDKLIAATRQLVIEQGMEGCSVEKICAAAGFTRGAFYSNFSSKDELYAALAQQEYHRLITNLRAVVDQWSAHAPPRPGEDEIAGAADQALMSQLLEEALWALRLDAGFYIIQNELLVRSVRDPAWAGLFHPVNSAFVRALAGALEAILAAVGRRPNADLMVITHGVIGIALRASCVGSWVTSAMTARGASPHEGGPLSVMYTRPGSEILRLIVTLLHTASQPIAQP